MTRGMGAAGAGPTAGTGAIRGVSTETPGTNRRRAAVEASAGMNQGGTEEKVGVGSLQATDTAAADGLTEGETAAEGGDATPAA